MHRWQSWLFTVALGCGLVFIDIVFIAIAVSDLAYAGADCNNRVIDERVTLDSVIDGDTLRLTNHQLVRLIGINSPEIHHDGTAPEPLARDAKAYLVKLLHKQKSLGLVYGRDTYDHYGRRLAHVFLEDGSNVQQKILEQGLGFWIAVPPNTVFIDCYRDAESVARGKRLGLWNEAYFQPKNPADSKSLKSGFQLFQGKITTVRRTKKSFWLNFNPEVSLRIAQKDMHNFQPSSLYALKGSTVIARGWLHRYKNQWIMQIRHPDAVEVQH